RAPVDVEVPFEMPVAGAVIRGRMDAVFAEPAGRGGVPRWLVVDWKTGQEPTGAEAVAAAVQLAAYRLAWARLNDLGDDQLGRRGGVFPYVRRGRTVRPVALPDAGGLRSLISKAG